MPTTQNKKQPHECGQVENIVSLKKDVEIHDKRITNVETRQDKLEELIIEQRELANKQGELILEQRKTNEFLEKTIAQNQKFIEKSDAKYDKEIEEIKDQLHKQQIQIITDNQKQDEKFNKEKMTLILKVLGWTVAIIGTLGGIIWNFLIK